MRHILAIATAGSLAFGGLHQLRSHGAHVQQAHARRPRVHMTHNATNLGSYKGFVLSNRGRSFLR